MRIRQLVTAIAIVGATVSLAGCAERPPTRTSPNSVERAAVAQVTSIPFSADLMIDDDAWVQLWTVNQAAKVMTDCVRRASKGDVVVEVSPPGRAAGQGMPFEFSWGVTGGDYLSTDDYAGVAKAELVVAGCLARTPVDDRVLRLPIRDVDALYSYDMVVLRKCLQAHGQDVERMPSRYRFGNLIRASAPWSPYDHVVVTSREAWYALSDACPALPRSLAADVVTLD